MRVKLQLVMCDDDGQEETVTDVVTLKKDHRRLEHLGLTLAEAKQLLKTLRHRVLQRQVDTFLAASSTCQDCGSREHGDAGKRPAQIASPPPRSVMHVDNMVDAALVGLDRGETVTMPSLPDIAEWEAYEATRQKMIPQLSRSAPALRYDVTALHPRGAR
jgi:hypothetical protein